MASLAPRAARMVDRLRIGAVLMLLGAAPWLVPLLCLWLPVPTVLRWAAVAVVALAEAFLLGVYMHDGDGDDFPPLGDGDSDGGGEEEWFETLPHGGGRP